MNYTAWSMELLAGTKARLEALANDLVQTPDQLQQLYATAAASLVSGAGVRGFTYVLILLLIGCGVEWLYWTYAYASWRAIHATPVSSPRAALRLGLRRLLLQAGGMLLFTVAT